MIGISRDIEFDLRNDLFAHLERLSYSYYQRNRTGDIMARATNDLNAVRMLLGPAIMYSANTIVFTAGALAFMLAISPKLTLFAFLPLPIASIVIQYFGRRIHERFERIQAMFSDISARAQENFSGARVIRAYVQEQAEISAFENANQEYIRRSLGLVRLMGMLWPTLELMLGAPSSSSSGSADEKSSRTFHVHPRHTLVPSFPDRNHAEARRLDERRGFRRLQHLHGATDLAGHRARMGHQHLPAWNRVAGAHQRNHRTKSLRSMDAPGAQDREIQGEIEFRNLNFAYDGTAVLKDINLRIPAGSSLAIVGPTGSGKTTLVNLIPRIYDAEPGARSHRRPPDPRIPSRLPAPQIGFVPQETFLFSDTIRENIALAAHEDGNDAETTSKPPPKPPTSPRDIESFPEGYNTASANAASRSPEARSSAPPSPAPCSAAHASSSSTTPSPASTPTPKTKSSTISAKSCADAPPSSSPTAFPPSATPTASPSSTRDAS